LKTYTHKCRHRFPHGSMEVPKSCQICSERGTKMLKLFDGRLLPSEPNEWTKKEIYAVRNSCKRCLESKQDKSVSGQEE